MRYGRRATVFSTTAVSWVCVLCSAVLAAWVLDLIPHRMPPNAQTASVQETTDIPLEFHPELQESQFEPQPQEASASPTFEVQIPHLFAGQNEAAKMVQAEPAAPMQSLDLAYSQPAGMMTTSLSNEPPTQAQPMSPESMVQNTEPEASKDPFAAYEAKQRSYEFVPAQGYAQSAPTSRPQDNFGWQSQSEVSAPPMQPQMTAEPMPVRTASLEGDGIFTPAAPASVTRFEPSNPHSGQFQQLQGAQFTPSAQKVNPEEVDAFVAHPGQVAQVSARTLTYNPERDNVQLLTDPYRGEATLQYAQDDASNGSVQQTSFASTTMNPSAFNSSSFGQNRGSSISSGSPRNLPTQAELMDRVIGVPESLNQTPVETSPKKSPQEEVQRLRTLSELYWSTPRSRPDVQLEIDELARKIYFSPSTHYMTPYTVQSGEMLQNISKTYDVPWQYLARLNRITPEKVRAGSQLKVIKGPFSAIVDLSDYELIIHAHGYYVCRFPVGCGKNDSTPTGTFVVKNKEFNPTYYGPEGVIAADDPLNPLGERWIDLGDSIGIHGTIEPDSIGKSQSKGCVRMLNEHVAIVYDLLGVGSEVTITP